jgi:hypothetical protein
MRLRKILACMLVMLVGAAALTPPPAGAQPATTPRVSAKGVPFVAVTAAGTFVGAFELQGFGSEGDELRVFGVIDGTLTPLVGPPIVTHENFSVVAPLQILQATCESLLLEMGPFPLPGDEMSQQPLQLHVDPGDNVLRRSSFCNIARAVQRGASAAELAALLTNPEATCDWWQEYIVCPLAFTLCAASCVLGPEVCVPCLAAVGLEACLPCFQ